ncbi:DUF983 domain-containing protein [Novosphingobium sp. APW14]|jgi:uncharacterized protein (DUF983 family)|uniref:DUF983 domain-containing protein n=1 Tax=Novosphingobium sp. APW14 TaxID=3077237 RepID=UPI0028DE8472|nr:DUF983 domain-containing protein [Novosphingobium sp. APW14]MDT9013353.1 DUF983 domain-containing protein [Novosphingobium sp. APW14]
MVDGSSQETKGQPGIPAAALFGLCPQCGARSLFDGPARFARRCGACGLDYSQFNVGDGPAAFLTMIVGALVVGLAVWLEFAVHPPFWVHIVLWVPLVAGLTLWGLRVSKAALLVAEYRRKAIEATNNDLRQP